MLPERIANYAICVIEFVSPTVLLQHRMRNATSAPLMVTSWHLDSILIIDLKHHANSRTCINLMVKLEQASLLDTTVTLEEDGVKIT